MGAPGVTAAQWEGQGSLQSQEKRPGRASTQETQKGAERGMSQAEGRGERDRLLVKAGCAEAGSGHSKSGVPLPMQWEGPQGRLP